MAAADPSTPPEVELHSAMQGAVLRAFFGVAAVLCGLGMVFALVTVAPLGPVTRLAMLLAYGALTALCIAGVRVSPARAHGLLAPLLLGGLALVGTISLVSGWGLLTPGLVFFSLLVFLANTLASARVAAASTGLALATLLALGAAERIGWLPPPALGVPPFAARLLLHCAAVVTGALMGRLVARLLRQHLQAAEAREQRFRALLGIAVNAYWETDASLRLTEVSQRDAAGRFVPVPAALGHLPWQVPAWPLEPDSADRMRAGMAARAPVHDLAFQWQPPAGPLRHFVASAEPRFDAQHRFIGYWGVGRDVSAEHQAHQALARSQALLARVVALSPDIITLTELRSGRYVMVNPSFARLLGHTVAQAEGHTSIELGLWRDLDDRAALLHTLAEHGAVQDRLLNFVTRSGQALPLLMSATRFDSDGQSYLLLSGRDMSQAQREQLEREAILANASVGIAFTRDRRFIMANTQFEQILGWPAGSVVGLPGRAMWADDAQYEAVGREIAPVLLRGEAVDMEFPMLRQDGVPIQLRMRAKAIDPKDPGQSGTIWVTEDVTQQRGAERELARARDAAEAANRAKSAFLANTSHEIRTPLNGVLGLARLARQPGLAPARQQQYLDQMAESAELLSTIISDVLDVAKIEAGRLQLESAPFHLMALLRSIELSFAALASSQGLGFEAEVDPALPPWVCGDALRVRQILANFLHNALKFTPSGAIRLVVRVLAQGGLRFEVHDTGIGIDADSQARLFEPFTQADESTSRHFGGTGLGLSICRDLAGLMGGSVGFSSQAGLGSCFHAELPLAAVVAPADAAPTPPPRIDGRRLRGLRVLLVEDNPVNMMIGVALLDQWGVLVSEAADGPQALAAVAQQFAAGQGFDAVLMDVQMPGMSGYETTRRLRQQHGARQLPVIALTAAALVSERDRAVASGMTDFLTKPVDPQRLFEALLAVLPVPGAAAASTDPVAVPPAA